MAMTVDIKLKEKVGNEQQNESTLMKYCHGACRMCSGQELVSKEERK